MPGWIFILLCFFLQYLGTCTPQKVKDRVTEVLYGWTLWLKEEPKIQEAYNMLKKQGDLEHKHTGNHYTTIAGFKKKKKSLHLNMFLSLK